MMLLIVYHSVTNLRPNNYVQYKCLLKFVTDKFESAVADDKELPTTVYMLKMFKNDEKECSELGRLLDFSVCFPVSEAIVESW